MPSGAIDLSHVLPLISDLNLNHLKNFVHSFLSDFLSQSGQIGTNPLFSAPPAVPNSASLLREVARGLSADSPTGVPLTESSGKVLPMTQVDVPHPNMNVHAVSFFLARGVVSSGGSLIPGLGHDVRYDGTDQLRVGGVSLDSSLAVASALSPTSFLFPVSDSGFALFPSSLSSSSAVSACPPPGLPLSVSSSLSSSFSSSSSSAPIPSALSASWFVLPPLSYPPLPSVLPPRPGVPVPPPPPGFPPMSLSSSSLLSYPYSHPVSSSSSILAPPPLPSLASSLPSSPFLPAFSSAPLSASAPSSAPVSYSSSSFSCAPSSSSSLDFAAYKAHVLELSDEYLSLGLWVRGFRFSLFFPLTVPIFLLTLPVISLLALLCSFLLSALCLLFLLVLLLLRSLFLFLGLRLLFLRLVFLYLFLVFLPPLLLLLLLSLLGLRPPVAPLLPSGFPLSSTFSSGLPPPPLSVPVLSSSSALPLSLSLPPAGSLRFVAAAADPVAAPAVPVAASAAPASLFRPFDVASATPGVAL